MNNPFARFAEQAEVGFADLSRRAIDSVTVPLKLKSQELIGEVTASIGSALRTVLIKAAFAVVAAILAIVAICFAVAAIYDALANRFGPIEAALILAAAFAILAVVALVGMSIWPRASATADEVGQAAREDAENLATAMRREAKRADRKLDDVASAAASDEETVDLKSGLSAIASALGDAGFKREGAGLRAGLALSEQLRPMQLVSLALLGGFIAGFRMSKRR